MSVERISGSSTLVTRMVSCQPSELDGSKLLRVASLDGCNGSGVAGAGDQAGGDDVRR